MLTVSTIHTFFSLTVVTVAAGALLVGAGLGTAQAGADIKIYPGTMCELYKVTKAPENGPTLTKTSRGR